MPFVFTDQAAALALAAGLRAGALYVALIVLMGVVLTYLVINQRRSKRIGIGDGGEGAEEVEVQPGERGAGGHRGTIAFDNAC